MAGLVQGVCACLWVLPQRAPQLPTDAIAISVYTTTDGLYLYTDTICMQLCKRLSCSSFHLVCGNGGKKTLNVHSRASWVQIGRTVFLSYPNFCTDRYQTGRIWTFNHNAPSRLQFGYATASLSASTCITSYCWRIGESYWLLHTFLCQTW